jgi:DNA anti-recombination protein RmuC
MWKMRLSCLVKLMKKTVWLPIDSKFPLESLYAEVLRHPEVFEKLQRTYRVTITSPTTLSA